MQCQRMLFQVRGLNYSFFGVSLSRRSERWHLCGCTYSREFDENLLRRITEVFYEDDVLNLPPAPDVSNYLMSEVYELANILFLIGSINVYFYLHPFLFFAVAVFGCKDAGFVPNGIPPPINEAMYGVEVERRLSHSVSFFFLSLLVCYL